MDNNNQENLTSEQKELVKKSVEDGSYFKDGLEWFVSKYIEPITEKTFLIFLSIIGVVITYTIVTMITNLLPLTESVPIVLKERDSSTYLPIITKLIEKDTKTTNEAILKYLVINYVKDRENHYYPKGNLSKYTSKFERIKNSSSNEAFVDFKKFMSKNNKQSPIHYFGKDIERKIEIQSFKFVRLEKTFFNKAGDFFMAEKMPQEALITYKIKIIAPLKTIEETTTKRLSFNFSGIRRSAKKEYLPLNFKVISYIND
jgi:type IV secretory pathway component VirB8